VFEPGVHSRDQRLECARRVADALLQKLGDRVLAIGVYGSTGRGEDRPYSDLEMLCIVPGVEDIGYLCWVEEGLKISVDVMSPERITQSVQTVEEDWPITGSEYTLVAALYDPTGFWESLKPIQDSIPDSRFKSQIRGVMLGYIFEYLCKLKNEHASGSYDNFAYIATEVAHCGAWLMGLHHRHLYRSNTSHLGECITLPDRPAGLDDLLSMVMAGELSDHERTMLTIEKFWVGAVAWCETKAIPLQSSLEQEMLKLRS
jgi:kanamycin nucleotidyltransferase